MESNDAKLHYMRAIHQIDKMYSTYFDAKDVVTGESDYYNTLVNSRNKYFYYDLNNMLILCSIALMGLNKESIEDSVNHLDYKYNIDYSVPSFETIVDTYLKKYNIPVVNRDKLKKLLEFKSHEKYSFFNDKRSYPTPYDKWLKVESQNNVQNFTWNYLSCVRNALMHSSYLVQANTTDKDNYNIEAFMDIKNDDYKNLSAKIFIPNYLDFIKFYYSNIAHYGVMSSLYMLYIDEKYKHHIESPKDLKEIIDNIEIAKFKINNTSQEVKETFEYRKIKDKSISYVQDKDMEDLDKEEVEFTLHNKEVLNALINEFYGNDFYKYDTDEQIRLIYNITCFIHNPKTILNSGIIAIYENIINVGRKNDKYIALSSESYILEAVMLILKSYAILYRIQNSHFEEIDYKKMEQVNYEYSETDPYHLNLYNEFKNKLMNKGINEDEITYQKRYITEIIRDALAHGNISMDFDIKENKVIQRIIFDDAYKGKNRTIKIELSELNKYLSSECFSRKEIKEKCLSLTK